MFGLIAWLLACGPGLGSASNSSQRPELTSGRPMIATDNGADRGEQIPAQRPGAAPRRADETSAAAATATTTTTTTIQNTTAHARGQLSKRALGPSPAGHQSAATATTTTTTTSQGQQQLAQQLQFLQQLRLSESDLLPFSDFNVQQPAFGDIMKTWPPTTRRGASAATSSGRPAGGRARARGQYGQRLPSSVSSQAGHQRPLSFADSISSHFGGGGGHDSPLVRNHLNEDYDDTIVTADESFEQDQLPEPPTWVNYLGELGDFIYAHLSAYFEQSARSPFAGSGGTSASQTPMANSSTTASQKHANVELIDDLLDDFYYDQYENSQVLYYGPQLVRQGDIFEIGCYLPHEQPAEWTKSGRALGAPAAGGSPQGNRNSTSSLWMVKSGDFLGAKQNYSLKVFEAQVADSGNYRCNRMSRKYHKLIVVPARISTSQLYLIQQRLLSVVSSSSSSNRMSEPPALGQQQIQLATLYQASAALGPGGVAGGKPAREQPQGRGRPPAHALRIEASGYSGGVGGSSPVGFAPSGRAGPTPRYSTGGPGARPPAGLVSSHSSSSLLVQGHLIQEGQPLQVACQLGDEFVLRKLRELPHFQLAWYKNGRLLRASQQPPPAMNSSQATPQQGPLSRGQSNSPSRRTGGSPAFERGGSGPSASGVASQQRVQFLGPNGRLMSIGSPTYADAGDYLCSWSKLGAALAAAARQADFGLAEPNGDGSSSSGDSSTSGDFSSASSLAGQQLGQNPLSAASHHQVLAPVKLRPFKSAYHVRQDDQLRLVCQVQRGYPAAQISWYVGNQLLDGDFLREHSDEFRVLQLRSAPGGRAFSVSSSSTSSGSNSNANGAANPQAAQQNQQDEQSWTSGSPQIVEINPIPAGRQQMQLTANGRGQWLEYRNLASEKYAIDTPERQLRYLQMKLGQLTGTSNLVLAAQAAQYDSYGSSSSSPSSSSSSSQAGLLAQASLSVLVVNKLDKERHTSRYACRATTRANTDEVTTVIRVKDSTIVVNRPQSRAATLIPGQPLHFECGQVYNKNAQFIWYKRNVTPDETAGPTPPLQLDPNMDDTIEIHNERLTLLKPGYSAVGDYICRALNEDRTENEKEFGEIRVRSQPYVGDFGIETSHTGKSATIAEGSRLELLCQIRDQSVPVNITWVMSESPDRSDRVLPVPEYEPNAGQGAAPSFAASEAVAAMNGASMPDLGIVPTYLALGNVMVERVDAFSKKLIIREAGQEHRGYYTCVVSNGVTESTRKEIYIRVKDKIVALWPFLGILAELFILFTIIYVWETQRAQKTLNAKSGPPSSSSPASKSLVPPMTPGGGGGGSSSSSQTATKRLASGPSNAFESVPLNG